MTDAPLSTTAAAFAAALPASVGLPAGGGKTHILAATVRELVNRGGRVLVLTHTNAGVHAVRQRLKGMLVPAVGYRVATITSFAFTMARPYPQLAEMDIPPAPDWADSTANIQAAGRVARSRHIRRTISATFTHLIVDEYQDCSRSHHDLISVLAEALPLIGVLGDRMQAIFGFAEPLVTWEQVQERFPDHPVRHHPWRWQGHNEPLGQWLLDLRDRINPGTVLDLSTELPVGVSFTQVDPTRRVPALKKIGNTSWPANESVLVISGKKAQQTRATAAHLGGRFTAMEEVGGSYMREKLAELGTSSPDGYAAWLARTTKDCFCGHADLNKGVLDKLDKRQPVGKLKRAGLENALKAMDSVLEHRTLASLAAAMDTVRSAPALRLHSHEAWFDMLTAIRGASVSGLGPGALTSELAKIRDRIRHSGRPERRRVVSRTLLVKGLEFDHVIIANVDEINDQYNFYVALNRARKTLTLLGSSPRVLIQETPLAPKTRAI